MNENDLTIQILQGIRSETRDTRLATEGLRGDVQGLKQEVQGLKQEVQGLTEEFHAHRELSEQRFDVVETTLKELCEQMVFHSRALRSLLDVRDHTKEQLSDHEARITRLEGASR